MFLVSSEHFWKLTETCPVRSDVVKETTLKEPAVSPGTLPSGLEAQWHVQHTVVVVPLCQGDGSEKPECPDCPDCPPRIAEWLACQARHPWLLADGRLVTARLEGFPDISWRVRDWKRHAFQSSRKFKEYRSDSVVQVSRSHEMTLWEHDPSYEVSIHMTTQDSLAYS